MSRWLCGVALVAATGVTTSAVLWAQDQRTFVTHPVSVLALGTAAVVVTWVARTSAPDPRPWLLALGSALATYLLLGCWATGAPGSVSAGLWSAGWIPVNSLLAAVGLAAAGLRRTTWAVVGLSGACVVASAVLVRPVAPFEGLATAAPEAWRQSVPALVDGLVLLWELALVAATVAVTVRAVRASVVDRRRLARAAAVASTAPCLVVTCLALAVLRDPGEVDPTTGSIAYTCAIGFLAVLAAWGVGSDDRAAVRLVAATWGASVVVLAGVAVAGPMAADNPAVGVVAVVLLTLGVAGGVVAGLARFETWSQPPAPRAIASTVPGLTPRENDVLAAVARGGTNAAVAAELFLSERTVEQHLRSVFDKLDLGDHGGSNRRVRAAALWWEQRSGEELTGS